MLSTLLLLLLPWPPSPVSGTRFTPSGVLEPKSVPPSGPQAAAFLCPQSRPLQSHDPAQPPASSLGHPGLGVWVCTQGLPRTPTGCVVLGKPQPPLEGCPRPIGRKADETVREPVNCMGAVSVHAP